MPQPSGASRRSTRPLFAAPDLQRDWRFLCETLGERRAGTAAEQCAADFIAQRFREAGAADVRIEPFPCHSLRSATVEVHARETRAWREVEGVTFVGAPGTPGGKTVTGELVWLELPENARRLGPRSLRGRIAAIFGPLPTSAQIHRRLVASEPLAVIHVDDRLPFSWAKNDGVYPHWVRTHGMPPTIAVPYLDGWRWRRDGVNDVRLRVAPDLVPAESQNVIAEIPGREPHLPGLVLTAHHDTQCGNPGADDNASGVVSILAVARALQGRRLRRTLRLISFGAEEQLSVGSAAYVRRHRLQSPDVGLAINFDSVSSPLGHWTMIVAGDGNLARHATRRLAARGLDVSPQTELTPFSDHFPFNRAGVPSLWFMRTNFPGGRWQHHSPHDTLENVSVVEVQRLLGAVLPFVTELANQSRWPFAARLPASMHTKAKQIGRELYG